MEKEKRKKKKEKRKKILYTLGGAFYLIFTIMIILEGDPDDVGAVVFTSVVMIFCFYNVFIIVDKENQEKNFINKLESIVGENISNLLKQMDSKKLLEELPHIYELGKKETWGRIIIAFEYDSKFVYVFEEGLYFFTLGKVQKFISKDKINIKEKYNRKDSYRMPAGLEFMIVTESDEEIINLPRDLYYESINIFLNWYGSINKDLKILEKYDKFKKEIEELNKDYILYTLPYDLKNLSYGQFLLESSLECLVFGKNIENNSFIIETGYFLEGFTRIVDIPYENIGSISIEGDLDVYSNFLDFDYKEGKWDSKRLAGGYLLAGPAGAAMLGKSKPKYVPPSNINYQVFDSREIGMFLNESYSITPTNYTSGWNSSFGNSGNKLHLFDGHSIYIEFKDREIIFPYNIMIGYFESFFPKKIANFSGSKDVKYENYQRL